MQSGCLCCSIRGDLSKTIERLLRKNIINEINFERIVIETTGLADPGPIMQTLLMDNILASNTRLDGVVTVADAINGTSTLEKQFEAVSQAALADLIIISKTDIARPEQIQDLKNQLEKDEASYRSAIKSLKPQIAKKSVDQSKFIAEYNEVSVKYPKQKEFVFQNFNFAFWWF